MKNKEEYVDFWKSILLSITKEEDKLEKVWKVRLTKVIASHQCYPKVTSNK